VTHSMIIKLRNRRGVTGLENAIILVAFVITAAPSRSLYSTRFAESPNDGVDPAVVNRTDLYSHLCARNFRVSYAQRKAGC